MRLYLRIYTMLSTGEIEDDPIAEEVKGLTDGHLVLSRKLAEQGHYPALEINKSLSRVANRFFNVEEIKIIQDIRSLYAILREEKELVALGGLASEMHSINVKLEMINKYLRPNSTEDFEAMSMMAELRGLVSRLS